MEARMSIFFVLMYTNTRFCYNKQFLSCLLKMFTLLDTPAASSISIVNLTYLPKLSQIHPLLIECCWFALIFPCLLQQTFLTSELELDRHKVQCIHIFQL